MTATFTAAALLCHMVLGCCCHHAHAEPIFGSSAEELDCNHLDGDDGDQDDGDHDGSCPDHHKGCSGQSCVAIRTLSNVKSVELLFAGWLADQCVALTADIGLDCQSLVTADRTEDSLRPLPVRAHLLFSVLLI